MILFFTSGYQDSEIGSSALTSTSALPVERRCFLGQNILIDCVHFITFQTGIKIRSGLWKKEEDSLCCGTLSVNTSVENIPKPWDRGIGIREKVCLARMSCSDSDSVPLSEMSRPV